MTGITSIAMLDFQSVIEMMLETLLAGHPTNAAVAHGPGTPSPCCLRLDASRKAQKTRAASTVIKGQ